MPACASSSFNEKPASFAASAATVTEADDE
jgi:hypothetical protein